MASVYTPPEQLKEQQQSVGDLKDQIFQLQQELVGLRSATAANADVDTLRRSYAGLIQHVRALEIESKVPHSTHITNLVEQLETAVITPEYVAQEMGIVASVTATVFAIDRVLRMLRVQNAGQLSQLAAATGAIYMGFRVATSTGSRIVSFLQGNRKTKAMLQEDWRLVNERINVLAQLAQKDLARLQELSATQASTATPPEQLDSRGFYQYDQQPAGFTQSGTLPDSALPDVPTSTYPSVPAYAPLGSPEFGQYNRMPAT